MAHIRKGPKVIIGALVIGAAFLGLKYAASNGMIHGPIAKILVPSKVNLPDIKDAQLGNVAPAAYPLDRVASVPATQIRAEVWEWNAQADFIYANGGPA